VKLQKIGKIPSTETCTQTKIPTCSSTNSQSNRRRSKSCSASVKRTKILGSNEPTNVYKPNRLAKIPASPCNTGLKRMRQASVDRTPAQPLYRGVKFIPKQINKYAQSNENPKVELQKQDSVDQKPVAKPLIMGSNALKTRATPGGSFKHKDINMSAILSKFKPKNYISSSSLASNDSKILDNTQDSIISTSTKINESSCAFLKTRKISETKPVAGLLHTELRALKRNEFEQQLKEKERVAVLKRRDLDMEKMRKQHEEIQKLRAQSQFKSNPIKHYRPVDLRPSERPLTSPRSPHFKQIYNKVPHRPPTSSTNQSASSTYSTDDSCINKKMDSLSLEN